MYGPFIVRGEILYGAGQLPKFKDVYGRYLQSANSPSHPVLDQNHALARIGEILGTDESILENMRFLFDGPLSSPKSLVWDPQQATLVFADQQRIKSFLREGGQLPGYSYDRATDTAAYSTSQVSFSPPSSPFEWILPIGPDFRLEHEMKALLEALQNYKGMPPGVIIHEAAEMALVRPIKFEDRYWRWFSEGVANAVAVRLLREMIGPQAAKEHEKTFSTEPYNDLKGKINLQYWMAANYCIETKLEDEKRLELARYAFASYEIQRLVEIHGFDCIRKISDILTQQLSVTSRTICQAIYKVSGEDMNERLMHYQQFKSHQEGVSQCVSAYNEYIKAEDVHSLLTVLLRMMELETNLIGSNGLNLYVRAAGALAKIGREQEADAVMEKCIELFTDSNLPKGREAAILGFLPFALLWKEDSFSIV